MAHHDALRRRRGSGGVLQQGERVGTDRWPPPRGGSVARDAVRRQPGQIAKRWRDLCELGRHLCDRIGGEDDRDLRIRHDGDQTRQRARELYRVRRIRGHSDHTRAETTEECRDELDARAVEQ